MTRITPEDQRVLDRLNSLSFQGAKRLGTSTEHLQSLEYRGLVCSHRLTGACAGLVVYEVTALGRILYPQVEEGLRIEDYTEGMLE